MSDWLAATLGVVCGAACLAMAVVVAAVALYRRSGWQK